VFAFGFGTNFAVKIPCPCYDAREEIPPTETPELP